MKEIKKSEEELYVVPPTSRIPKEQVLNYPRFPEYLLLTNQNQGTVTFISTVHGHLENYTRVDIYLIPVVNTFKVIFPFKFPFQQKLCNIHLTKCLTVSKYHLNTFDALKYYPVVDVLQKADPDFLDKLHNQYY